MDQEMELRTKLAKMYSLISSKDITSDRLEAANQKLSEAIGILSGAMPVPVKEESHG